MRAKRGIETLLICCRKSVFWFQSFSPPLFLLSSNDHNRIILMFSSRCVLFACRSFWKCKQLSCFPNGQVFSLSGDQTLIYVFGIWGLSALRVFEFYVVKLRNQELILMCLLRKTIGRYKKPATTFGLVYHRFCQLISQGFFSSLLPSSFCQPRIVSFPLLNSHFRCASFNSRLMTTSNLNLSGVSPLRDAEHFPPQTDRNTCSPGCGTPKNVYLSMFDVLIEND